MALETDTRGWLMAIVSGIACLFGSTFICIDIFVRLLPGMRGFRIEDSNTFLACSLCLSFGVMSFSAMYGMLPSARSYLIQGGLAPDKAAYTLISLFLAGAVFIQVFSGFIHRWMPSHVVDCDHSHKERSEDVEDGNNPELQDGTYQKLSAQQDGNTTMRDLEDTPLLSRTDDNYYPALNHDYHTTRGQVDEERTLNGPAVAHDGRRPSLAARVSHIFESRECDTNGPCFGYSEPCGAECFKVLQRSNSHWDYWLSFIRSRRSSTSMRQPPASLHNKALTANSLPSLEETAVDSTPSTQEHVHSHGRTQSMASTTPSTVHSAAHPSQHHHHVPTNAFLSIGLQTSIAIALHKLPEGFITYATNHANPTLGLTVFLALFIHNITEGFAMALPLYLALGSRWKAWLWSSFLGGASQPVGAAIAMLWFHVAGNRKGLEPGEAVYGGMFAVTAGIMTSVSLKLWQEGSGLTHRKGLCEAFAFIGFGILGVSFALTA